MSRGKWGGEYKGKATKRKRRKNRKMKRRTQNRSIATFANGPQRNVSISEIDV